MSAALQLHLISSISIIYLFFIGIVYYCLNRHWPVRKLQNSNSNSKLGKIIKKTNFRFDMLSSGEPSRKRPFIEIDKPSTVLCTVVAMDYKNLFYRVCSACERTLPDNPGSSCRHCNLTNSFNPGFKRLFRVLVSIATDTKILVVIMFDRAARVLFGCSADEFFHFAKTHPYASTTASKALEGEMLTVTLSKPKNGNAQHLRVVSVIPMRSDFQPAIHTLRELYPP